jgi:hypothetical protein
MSFVVGQDTSGHRGKPRKRRASGSSRLRHRPPPNQIDFYLGKSGLTQDQLADSINEARVRDGKKPTTRQQIGKLKNGQSNLSAEWADYIGRALGVEGSLIGYSDSPDAYAWAAKAIPIMGYVTPELLVEQTNRALGHIGLTNTTRTTQAFQITEGAIVSQVTGWFLLADMANRQPISELHISDQDGYGYLSCTMTGDLWWRRIIPTAIRGRYHLEADNRRPVYDVVIDWVTPVLRLEPPGKGLPPIIEP